MVQTPEPVFSLPMGMVAYLTRQPSHGRGVAVALRSSKGQQPPIIFVDGTEIAVQQASEQVPDALFTTSAGLKFILSRFAVPDNST